MSGPGWPAGDTAVSDGMAGLAHVTRHAVELMEKLGRHPDRLRIQAGDVMVDITWTPQIRQPDGPPRDVAAVLLEPSGESAGDEAREYLASPTVGVFYHAKEPGAEPFVSVGSLVQPGQQIGIVEAMKLMIPVEADRAGIITDVLKADGAPVEYDEPLFAVVATEA